MICRCCFLIAATAILISACARPIEDDRLITVRIAEDVRSEFDGDRALASVAVLDNHIRWPGNSGFDASIDHVVESLEAAGFLPEKTASANARLTYRVEEYPMDVPAWQPLGATIRIQGESKPLMTFASNRNMLANNSFSTPGDGIVIDVIDAGDGSIDALDAVDVRGKAVIADRDINDLFADAVIARGAAGVLAYSMPDYTQPQKNRDAVQFGDVPYDDSVLSWGILLSYNAQERLRKALSNGAVRIELVTNVEWTRNAVEKTVVAKVQGSARPRQQFVFSAHIQEPGANDNASGVAVQLEMARVAARLIERGEADPGRSITFLWGNEFVSTHRFVTQDPAQTENILWGISMDMVGEDTAKTGGTFLIEKMPDPSAIWARGDESFSDWGGQPISKDDLVPHYLNDVVLNRALEQSATNGWVVKTNPFEGGSDHVPFLHAGIPGLLLWHFTDQFYHTNRDRLEMVSAPEMKNVGVTALTTALTLASADSSTMQQLVAEVLRAATMRLRIETSLSVAAIRNGSDVPVERDIIETWASWYDEALLATKDIEVGGASAASQLDIEAARTTLRDALADHLRLLAD